MKDKVFLDTNVLIYAYDNYDSAKHLRARHILELGLTDDNAVLSSQVLGEFFSAVTRKIKTPLTSGEAGEIVEALSALYVQEVDQQTVKRAIDVHKRYQVSYWDGQIVAAAEQAGCKTVYSEDLSHKQSYFHITIINPFL